MHYDTDHLKFYYHDRNYVMAKNKYEKVEEIQKEITAEYIKKDKEAKSKKIEK